MNRTTWLQDRRMQKFRDVLSRWKRKELSAMEAGELLGCSERQFRRYRQRYEEDGLDGLVDRRLGKASAKRVPVDEIAWMLDQYRSHHQGWTVKQSETAKAIDYSLKRAGRHSPASSPTAALCMSNNPADGELQEVAMGQKSSRLGRRRPACRSDLRSDRGG
jgi:hypothetical protein